MLTRSQFNSITFNTSNDDKIKELYQQANQHIISVFESVENLKLEYQAIMNSVEVNTSLQTFTENLVNDDENQLSPEAKSLLENAQKAAEQSNAVAGPENLKLVRKLLDEIEKDTLELQVYIEKHSKKSGALYQNLTQLSLLFNAYQKKYKELLSKDEISKISYKPVFRSFFDTIRGVHDNYLEVANHFLPLINEAICYLAKKYGNDTVNHDHALSFSNLVKLIPGLKTIANISVSPASIVSYDSGKIYMEIDSPDTPEHYSHKFHFSLGADPANLNKAWNIA